MAGKRTRTKQAAPKRSKASKEAEGGDAFFLGDSDDERAQPSGKKTLSEYQDQVEDEEARETVAEKRHRLGTRAVAQSAGNRPQHPVASLCRPRSPGHRLPFLAFCAQLSSTWHSFRQALKTTTEEAAAGVSQAAAMKMKTHRTMKGARERA